MKFLKYYILLFAFIIFCQCNMLGQNKSMDSLNLLLKKSNLDTNSLNLYKKLCDLCDISENLKYGTAGLNSTNKLLSSNSNLNSRKKLLDYKIYFIKIIKVYYDDKKDYSKSIDYSNELYPIYSELKDTAKFEAEFSSVVSNLMKMRKTTIAFDSLINRLKYYEKIGDKKYIAHYQSQIASLFISLNNPKKSIEYFQKSLKTFEEINAKKDIAATLAYMASQYNENNEPEKALEANLKSLKLFEEENDPRKTFLALFGISTDYLRLRDFKKALEYNDKCLVIANELNDKYFFHWIYIGRSNIYETAKDYKSAEIYALKSYDIGTETKFKDFSRSSSAVLTELYFNMKDYNLALKYASECEDLSKELNDLYQLKSINWLQFKIYQRTNNFEKALKYHLEYIVLNDSINKIERLADFEKKEIQFEFEKNEAKKALEQEKKDALLMEEKLQQTILRNAFIIGFLLLLIVIALIFRSYRQKQKANEELFIKNDTIEKQKHLVEEKQKEIIESITYAKRLQEAILPPQEFIDKHIPNNFILYKPKDLVAGDFYWAEKINDLFFIAAADSTGHGVPGAMVSVVCSNALNRTVKEFNLTSTGEILDQARELVLETFEKSTSEVKDGMDISLLCIDSKNKNIFWSGANNPLWYIQDNQLKEIKADKQPIGKTEYPKPFTTHKIEYIENTTFYLFTDGFADQFGGPNGKKFKYKQFSDLLFKNKDLLQLEQSNIIDKAFTEWKGDLEQVDDVCVIGIKI